jgi:hypothetical protein
MWIEDHKVLQFFRGAPYRLLSQCPSAELEGFTAWVPHSCVVTYKWLTTCLGLGYFFLKINYQRYLCLSPWKTSGLLFLTLFLNGIRNAEDLPPLPVQNPGYRGHCNWEAYKLRELGFRAWWGPETFFLLQSIQAAPGTNLTFYSTGMWPNLLEHKAVDLQSSL